MRKKLLIGCVTLAGLGLLLLLWLIYGFFFGNSDVQKWVFRVTPPPYVPLLQDLGHEYSARTADNKLMIVISPDGSASDYQDLLRSAIVEAQDLAKPEGRLPRLRLQAVTLGDWHGYGPVPTPDDDLPFFDYYLTNADGNTWVRVGCVNEQGRLGFRADMDQMIAAMRIEWREPRVPVDANTLRDLFIETWTPRFTPPSDTTQTTNGTDTYEAATPDKAIVITLRPLLSQEADDSAMLELVFGRQVGNELPLLKPVDLGIWRGYTAPPLTGKDAVRYDYVLEVKPADLKAIYHRKLLAVTCRDRRRSTDLTADLEQMIRGLTVGPAAR